MKKSDSRSCNFSNLTHDDGDVHALFNLKNKTLRNTSQLCFFSNSMLKASTDQMEIIVSSLNETIKACSRQ